MSSPSKSPTPSPKSSLRLKHLPPPHNSSSDSPTILKTSSPLDPSVSPKRVTPLASSPVEGGIQYRLCGDSTGSTVRSPSPARVDVFSRIFITDSLQRDRPRSPHRGRAPSSFMESDSHSPELSDGWWGNRELLARPWHEPHKHKQTVPSEQTERWQVTRQVCNRRL